MSESLLGFNVAATRQKAGWDLASGVGGGMGMLGWFSHPELTKESPNHVSGNYGLLDQIAASMNLDLICKAP